VTDKIRKEGWPVDSNDEARRVDQPGGAPPDEDLAYDPEMTDTDEANIPADSAADPRADPRANADTGKGQGDEGDRGGESGG
jgi:hypothetical protein